MKTKGDNTNLHDWQRVSSSGSEMDYNQENYESEDLENNFYTLLADDHNDQGQDKRE